MINKRQSEDDTETGSEELTTEQLDSVAGAAPAPSTGSLYSPDSADQVVVAFPQDTPRQPVIVGDLWNGGPKPPTSSS
jgi:hypothetical protein